MEKLIMRKKLSYNEIIEREEKLDKEINELTSGFLHPFIKNIISIYNKKNKETE